jgi:hypothetical protein
MYYSLLLLSATLPQLASASNRLETPSDNAGYAGVDPVIERLYMVLIACPLPDAWVRDIVPIEGHKFISSLASAAEKLQLAKKNIPWDGTNFRSEFLWCRSIYRTAANYPPYEDIYRLPSEDVVNHMLAFASGYKSYMEAMAEFDPDHRVAYDTLISAIDKDLVYWGRISHALAENDFTYICRESLYSLRLSDPEAYDKGQWLPPLPYRLDH